MNDVAKGVADSVSSSVLDLIRRHDLLGGRERLLVAVSGGQDSVCLLHVLFALREKLNLELHVAHLDHGLRGTESGGDAFYVARLAKRLGIPATIEKRDVKSFRTKNKLSLEEAAREVRYGFFTDVAVAVGTDRVAVAHTVNDHIETVLMHLIRGSGLRGLRGLRPVNQWQAGNASITVVRPLLGTTREETAVYCRLRRLRPRADSSNLSMSPFRNRVRLELLPLLKKYNPRIDQSLQRISVQAAETGDYVDQECRRLWDGIVRREGGSFVLDKRKFLGISPVMQKSLVLLVLERLQTNLINIESRHIDEITAALDLPAGRSIDLPGGLIFTVDYHRFLLSANTVASSPLPHLEGEIKLKIPGKTTFSGWTVSAEINPEIGNHDVPFEPVAGVLEKGDNGFYEGPVIEKAGGFTAYLDFEKTGKDLGVRSLETGDIFQPLGMEGPKKVARFMIDARIPRSWRRRVPIVVSPRRIVWVAGWRIDEQVRITERTRNVLRLEFSRAV